MKKIVNYFRIKLGLSTMTIDEEITFTYGIHVTGDPDITTVTFNDAALQGKADLVQADAAKRLTQPSKSLTAAEQLHVNDLTVAIETTKNEVEVQANKKALGNRIIFDEIVNRVGMNPKAPYTRRSRDFEFLPAEGGSFHVWVPAAGKGNFTYYFKYGITPTINVPPTVFIDTIALPVTEIIVNGFKSGTIIAVQRAVVAHPKSKNGQIPAPDPNDPLSKVLTIPTVNNRGKVVINQSAPFLHWSEFLYYVIGGVETAGSPR